MRLAIPLTMFALLSAGPATAQPPFWYWRSQPRTPETVSLDLVRANVRIIRREGPVEISSERRAGFGRGAEVRLVMEDDGSSVTIRDIHPQSIAGQWDECLPPASAHGDFWTNAATFNLTIRAPRRTRISVNLLDGLVDDDLR